MSSSEYSVNLGKRQFDSLWETDSEDFPYGEDPEEIDRILTEELSSPRRRKRKKKSSE